MTTMSDVWRKAYLQATILRNSIARHDTDRISNHAARLVTQMTRVRTYCDQRYNCPR